jgi:hypothetical protein
MYEFEMCKHGKLYILQMLPCVQWSMEQIIFFIQIQVNYYLFINSLFLRKLFNIIYRASTRRLITHANVTNYRIGEIYVIFNTNL